MDTYLKIQILQAERLYYLVLSQEMDLAPKDYNRARDRIAQLNAEIGHLLNLTRIVTYP